METNPISNAQSILLPLVEEDIIRVRPSDKERFFTDWERAFDQSSPDVAHDILLSLLSDDVIVIRPSDRDLFIKNWGQAMSVLRQ